MPTAVESQTLKRYRSRRWRRSVTQTRNYDQDYAIQSVGGLNYTVDTQGNIKTITDAAGGNGFDYDNLDRLTKVKNSATLADVTALTYDKTGNRLTKKIGTAAVQNYTYATTNHRLNNVAGVARTLDANGNTTKSDTAKFFTYDARNRLVDFRTGTTAATIVSQYQFNAKGERVRKYKGTTDQSRYLYNEGGQLLIQNKVVSGVTTTQEMIWLDDMPIGINQGGTLHGILTDHLNSPRAVFEMSTQKTVWRWNAVDDAFGEKLALEDPDGNAVLFKLDMRFSGQLFDSESGMAYNYYRDCYEASTGRYCESDPIGLAGGMSSYGYVGGNPVNAVDPLGLQTYFPIPTGSYGYPRRYAPAPARRLTKCEKKTLGSYFPKKDLSKILFITGTNLVPEGYSAITFGNNIYANPSADAANTPRTIALLGHEIAHSNQYDNLGFSSFASLYGVSYLVGRFNGLGHDAAYKNIPQEIFGYFYEDKIYREVKQNFENGKGCECN